MIRRISIVGLVLTLVTALLPSQVFADDSRPLASLRTAEGLKDALKAGTALQAGTVLQAGNVVNAQDPTRRAGSGVQVQRQQGPDSFFSSVPGRITIGALVAVAATFAFSTWHKPEIRRADTAYPD